MKVTHKKTRQHHYVIKNSSKQAKTVLIEQPVDNDWQLALPKQPSEKTRSLYRFEVAVEPNQSAKLTVEEHRAESEQIIVGRLEADAALSFATRAGRVNAAVEKSLRRFAELKQALDTATSDLRLTESQIHDIENEQPRIRQNLAQLDRNGDLYARYVKKLADQEDELEKLHKQQTTQQTKTAAQTKTLDDFVAGLNIE
jgi:chromosome segregation ATPase